MIASRKTQQSLAKKFLPVVCRTYLDRPQVLLEAPRRRPVDVVARGRAVLHPTGRHVEGIRLHGVARELLVEVRIEIPGPSLEHEAGRPALHQQRARLRERDEVAARVGPRRLSTVPKRVEHALPVQHRIKLVIMPISTSNPVRVLRHLSTVSGIRFIFGKHAERI